MIIKKQLANGRVLVTFTLPATIWAETITLVGDFNNWNTLSHPFQRSRDDTSWQVTLELDTGATYQFRYLVNGNQWQNDPQADGSAVNPFGGVNSILTL
ncbi:MAG: glycoside hydrolase [Chloroflexi bacterium]|nr:glycoside hydrolase [Chloroflexota bacterium]